MWIYILLLGLAVLQVSLTQNLSLLSTDECGISLGCWNFPPNCANENCNGILRWEKIKSKHFLIEMQAKDLSSFENGRYMAFGFSEDRIMGDGNNNRISYIPLSLDTFLDTVLECIIDANGESGEAYISFNDDKTNFQLLDSSQKLLKNKQTLLKDGKMVCSFELDLNEKDKVNKDEQPMIYDLESSYWMLLFATGLTNPDTGEKLIHNLDEGDEFYPWSTKKRVSLKEIISVKNMGQSS